MAVRTELEQQAIVASFRATLDFKTSHAWYHDTDGIDVDMLASRCIVIHSVDGWRDLGGEGAVAAKYWYHVPITRTEFYDRYWQCTLRRLAPGETVANMPDPYARPYDDEHLAYILRARATIRAHCTSACTDKAGCVGHDTAVTQFCDNEETHDAWDISIAYSRP